MATFSFDGVGDLMLSMQQIAEIPEDVQAEMLNTEADIVLNAIKSKGEAYGVHRTGETLAHIRKGKVKRDKDGNLCVYITFNGKNAKGTRYAEIAFINNYGKKNQAARPFFTDGIAASEDQAAKKADAVYDEWLQSKNL